MEKIATRDDTAKASREKTFDEIREEAFAKMSYSERRRAEKRAKLIREAFPDSQDRIRAEKNWMDLPWNREEFAKSIQENGKF